MSADPIRDALFAHVDRCWDRHDKHLLRVDDHPVAGSIPNFRVARIDPDDTGMEPFAYLTLGAWQLTREQGYGLEIVLLASQADDARHARTLADLVHVHGQEQSGLREGSVLPLGRGWMEGSACDHLLVMVPYPYGPGLEHVSCNALRLRILWVCPITAAEARYTEARGLEAIERRFEQARIDFLDPNRRSAV